MVLAFRPTHALLINGYEHTGEICCNCMDVMDGRRLLYSIVSCLLKHFTRKIKLKTLLDVSMCHTSLSGVRNVKFQTLLLGKCILTIRLTTKSVPPPQEHPRVFSVNYLFREANIVYHRKYHNIP